MKYKITIEKITEYPEEVTAWKDPENPNETYYSKYDLKGNAYDRAVSHQRPTGKTLQKSENIFTQTVDNESPDFIPEVIKSVNQLK